MAKKVAVTFNVSDDDPAGSIMLILRDALSEFCNKRVDAQYYVNQRYSAEYLRQHPDKAQQVADRCFLAERMYDGMDIAEVVVS